MIEHGRNQGAAPQGALASPRAAVTVTPTRSEKQITLLKGGPPCAVHTSVLYNKVFLKHLNS